MMNEQAQAIMDKTITLNIPWQGVRLRHPRDGSSDGWATIDTSRGKFVVRSRDGAFTATPLGQDNPGPDAGNADATASGIILSAQSVTLSRADGRWTGQAHLSGRELTLNDPRL